MSSPGELSPREDTSDIETVEAMLQALARDDVRAARDLLAPDIAWRNTGLPTLRGRQALTALNAMVRFGVSFSVVTHHKAAADGVVLTDRSDVLRIGPVRSVFPVRGTFVVQDGRIAVWDDQFSMRQFLVGFFRRLPDLAD